MDGREWTLLLTLGSQIILLADLRSQTIEKAELVESAMPVIATGGASLFGGTKLAIRTTFSAAIDPGATVDASNWSVLSGGKRVPIDSVVWKGSAPLLARVYGPFEQYDQLTVGFLRGEPVPVSVDPGLTGKLRWRFGQGKPIDFSVRRLTNQQSFIAFDYGIDSKIVDYNLSVPGGSFWIRSLSLNVNSNGTIGSSDTVRNGSQSSLGFSVNPFYFVGGLMYRGQVAMAYQVETKMSTTENSLFSVTNKSLRFSAEAEIPYTNVPMFLLHSVTRYPRMAEPLTVSVGYLPSGKDEVGNDVPSRTDVKATYELAFSPYLILQGDWEYSRFGSVLNGFNEASYYSITIAQDLNVVLPQLGVLSSLLRLTEETTGKHFLYYKVSRGKKAPAFQELQEQSIGFGTFL